MFSPLHSLHRNACRFFVSCTSVTRGPLCFVVSEARMIVFWTGRFLVMAASLLLCFALVCNETLYLAAKVHYIDCDMFGSAAIRKNRRRVSRIKVVAKVALAGCYSSSHSIGQCCSLVKPLCV